MKVFLEKELSYKVVGCLYSVRNKYGSQHKEKVYERALNEQFDLEGLKYVEQPRLNVYSVDTGKVLATYIPDKLIESKIIIEIKAQKYIPQTQLKRAVEYLKTSKYEILYLVNFGEQSFQPKRYIYTNDRKPFITLLKR